MAKSPERIGIENLLTIQRLGNKLNRDARQALRPLFDQLAALIPVSYTHLRAHET